MIFYGAVQRAPAQVTDRADKGVFKVITDDKVSAGFAIAGGKFLLTCDHVIGLDSKIKIEDSNSGSRNGYLVFHDSQLNVAVYRMDRPSSVSFVINTNSVKPGSMEWLAGPRSRYSTAEMTGIKREGDTAFVVMKGATSLEPGSPFLNSKGEVIGMYQPSDSGSLRTMSGISGYSLTQFLKAQSAPPSAPTVIGSLGQVLDTTRACESADLDSPTIFTASPLQYLLVEDFSADFLKVTLPTGAIGYIRASMVKIIAENVTTGTQGVVNGGEVVRAVKTFDTSGLSATASTGSWQAETARFVEEIFSTAGREISGDMSVQMDIGKSVQSVGELQIGDRIYFGSAKSLWVAIYIGNDEYCSVTRAGKLVTTKFTPTSSKPFFRALH